MDITQLLETPKEKARRANNTKLAAYFLELKKRTGAPDCRIIASIAAEGKFTQKSFSGVLAALRKTQTI